MHHSLFYKTPFTRSYLPNHRMKQKGEQRTVFNFKACQQKDWDEYRKIVDKCLQFNMANSVAPTKSTLSADKKSLNHKWQIFKDSILQAAKASLKTKKLGYKDKDNVLNKLITLRSEEHTSELQSLAYL